MKFSTKLHKNMDYGCCKNGIWSNKSEFLDTRVSTKIDPKKNNKKIVKVLGMLGVKIVGNMLNRFLKRLVYIQC